MGIGDAIMPSEDVEKIIAFTILIFTYLSIPIFLIILALLVFIDLRYILRFILGGNFFDLTIAILVLILTGILIYGLKTLIQWLRD